MSRSILFPFQLGSTLPEATEDEDQMIRNSLEQILMVQKGERICRPEVGSGLQSYLFEPQTPMLARLLVEEIRRSIRIQERRIILQDVQIKQNANMVSIVVLYRRNNAVKTMTINVPRTI